MLFRLKRRFLGLFVRVRKGSELFNVAEVHDGEDVGFVEAVAVALFYGEGGFFGGFELDE
jgi:hypothetical protein